MLYRGIPSGHRDLGSAEISPATNLLGDGRVVCLSFCQFPSFLSLGSSLAFKEAQPARCFFIDLTKNMIKLTVSKGCSPCKSKWELFEKHY